MSTLFDGCDREIPALVRLAWRLPATLVRRLASDIRRRRSVRRERAIARFLADNGGRLTDELEREIGNRFGVHPIH